MIKQLAQQLQNAFGINRKVNAKPMFVNQFLNKLLAHQNLGATGAIQNVFLIHATFSHQVSFASHRVNAIGQDHCKDHCA